MFVKTTKLNFLDSIELKKYRLKNYSLREHFHDTYSIGVLKQGLEMNTVEGKSLIGHANSAMIVNPYQVHANESFDNDSSFYKCFYLNQDTLKFFAKKLSLPTGNIFFTNTLIINPIVSELIMDLFDKKSNEVLFTKKLENLLEILLTNYQKKTDAANDNYNYEANALSDTIFRIHTDFFQSFNIESMAAACKLSKFQFIRYFKKITGLTPASYVIVCRINHAKSLLVKGISIIQVALDSGFYDQSHFCKYFKYFTGVSPIEYQRNSNILQAGFIK